MQALEQTAGRGRLQREWWSPYGKGCYLSVLLRPPIPLNQASRLTMLASLAAIHACQQLAGVTPRPKWPNDLLLEGRKLAGILTELEHQNQRLSYAVIGLGLNAAMTFTNTPLQSTAVSLQEISGRTIDIDALRGAYLEQLFTSYQQFLAGASPHEAWRKHLDPLGRQVKVIRVGQADLIGLAIDVTADGALLVQDTAGAVHTIWAGDVIPTSA